VHRRDHDPLKRGIIFQLGKKFTSSVRAIQGVINQLTRGYARSSRHLRQNNGSRPLFFPAFSFPPLERQERLF
jgi:hypothetical protein